MPFPAPGPPRMKTMRGLPEEEAGEEEEEGEGEGVDRREKDATFPREGMDFVKEEGEDEAERREKRSGLMVLEAEMEKKDASAANNI